MKRIVVFILVFWALYSCNNSHQKDNSTSLNLKQKYAPLLQGTWVMSSYINDLKRTRSPYKSSDILMNGNIVSILIDTNDVQGDSCDAGVSWNNHEGSDFGFYFRNGIMNNGFTLRTTINFDTIQYVDMGFNISGSDTLLIMYHFNKYKKLVDSVLFTKVLPDVSEDVGRGVQYIANKFVFSGKYNRTGSSGDNISVAFDANGKVSGWDSCSDYYIATDYIATDTIDFVELGVGDANMNKKTVFAYTIENDTIKLFETSKGKEEDLIVGKLKYVLKKME